MSDEQIVQFLENNVNYMVNNDIILWLFRTIGWWLVKGLSFLIGIGKDLYDFTFNLVDITSWSGVEDWLNEFKPLIMVILTGSLILLGFMYMFGKNKKHNVLHSILLFGVVVTSSTYLFSTFNQWTIVFKDAVIGGDGVADGSELINSNLYDILYIDEQIGLKNMSDDNRPQYSSLSKDEADYINITEVVDWDEVENSDTKDILKKKLLFKSGGASTLQDVSNGVAWTSIGNDLYFRYKFNFFTYFLDALAVVLIYFCLSYKNVRITYELFVGRVLATIKAGDLSTQKKLVKILTCIRDEYYALCFTAVTIRSYFIFSDFAKELAGSHSIMRGMVVLFVALCVIDGSNIMQQITGVDAGLSSMTGKLIAGSQMVQAATGAVNQRRMLHSMNKNSGDKAGKSDGMSGGRGNIEGSRIGPVQFGKDNGNSMDKDLNKKESQGAHNASTSGRGAEGQPETNGHKGQMDGMSGRTEPMSGPDGEQTAGMDGAGSAQDMGQEKGADGRQAMPEGEMAESVTGQTEQMDRELDESNGYHDSSYSDNDAAGEPVSETMSRTNPESNMFDKWGHKNAGEETGYSAKTEENTGENESMQPFHPAAQGGKKESTPYTEQNDMRKQTTGQQSFADEGRHSSGHSKEQQKKYPQSPRSSTTQPSEGKEPKAEIRTSENRTARITQEKLGRDRYVGGEAVSKKREKDSNHKWEK